MCIKYIGCNVMSIYMLQYLPQLFKWACRLGDKCIKNFVESFVSYWNLGQAAYVRIIDFCTGKFKGQFATACKHGRERTLLTLSKLITHHLCKLMIMNTNYTLTRAVSDCCFSQWYWQLIQNPWVEGCCGQSYIIINIHISTFIMKIMNTRP